MPTGEYALTVLLGVAMAFWLALCFMVWNGRGYGRIVQLVPQATRRHSNSPLVSILVAARNEERRVLRQAIASLLAQDDPNFEVIVVDDQSSDGTLLVLNELAARDARLRVVQGKELPPGWGGKIFALQEAGRLARGSWWLVTDADVIFAPQAVGWALEYAEQTGLDVLSLLPQAQPATFWDHVVVPAASFGVRLLFPLQHVNDPARHCAFLAGCFILMRRSALDTIGGYKSLKGVISEDVILAQRFKRAGFRLHLAEAPQLILTPAHGSLRHTWNACRKDAFTMLGRKVVNALVGAAFGFWLQLLPPLVGAITLATALGRREVSWPGIMAWGAYGFMVAAHVKISHRFGSPRRFAVLAFLGYGILIANLLFSTWSTMRSRKVVWRERSMEITPGGLTKNTGD